MDELLFSFLTGRSGSSNKRQSESRNPIFESSMGPGDTDRIDTGIPSNIIWHAIVYLLPRSSTQFTLGLFVSLNILTLSSATLILCNLLSIP